jgi:hypothetical protein
VPVTQGISVIIPHGTVYAVEAADEIVAFKASVPGTPAAVVES